MEKISTLFLFLALLAEQYVTTPQNVVVQVGATANMLCNVVEHNLSYHISWFKENSGIVANVPSPPVVESTYPNYEVYRIDSEDINDFNLQITDTIINNAGDYSCRITFPVQHASWLHLIIISKCPI